VCQTVHATCSMCYTPGACAACNVQHGISTCGRLPCPSTAEATPCGSAACAVDCELSSWSRSALPCLPCPALPCPALPCPALPCAALPCPAVRCPAVRCPAVRCPALPCPALPATRSCWEALVAPFTPLIGQARQRRSLVQHSKATQGNSRHGIARLRRPTDRRNCARSDTGRATDPHCTAPFPSLALHAPVQLGQLLGLLRRRLRRAHARSRCACRGRRAPVRRDVRGGRVRGRGMSRRLRADGVECVGTMLRPLRRCRSRCATRVRAHAHRFPARARAQCAARALLACDLVWCAAHGWFAAAAGEATRVRMVMEAPTFGGQPCGRCWHGYGHGYGYGYGICPAGSDCA
jgi:hypothetical protein